jgi:energy-coupling factor transport system ATP-binding protein
MIRLENVSHSYPGPGGQKILALENINLNIPKTSFTAIIGPNSSGKSTLGRVLSGLLIPASGKVLIEGLDIARWDQTLLHEAIGLIFPHPDDQIVFPTVEDDLVFGLENLHLDSCRIEQKVADILRFLGMEKYRRFSVDHLSGGQKQKIAIAAMVVRGLRYLILDEPISYLDAEAKREVLALVQRIHQAGATIIYLAGVFEELPPADKIVALDKGTVKWQGTFSELLQKPDEMVQWGIEPPPVVKLVDILQRSGLVIPHPVYTVNQLLAALEKLKNAN